MSLKLIGLFCPIIHSHHRFLESRGAAKTVKDMRDELKSIDLDSNNKVAFIEFLLFTYKRTTAQMFTAKPSDHLVAKLEEAIAQYKAVFEEKKKKVHLPPSLLLASCKFIPDLFFCYFLLSSVGIPILTSG
jgi:hypothetical protein